MKKVSNIKSAAAYARALYEATENSGVLQDVCRDISVLEDLPSETTMLLQKTDSPLWKESDKNAVLATLADKLNISSITLNMLKMLAQSNKMFLLQAVVKQFAYLYQQKHNIAQVFVTTATALNAHQEKRLIVKLEKMFHKNIALKYKKDASIIGGLIIQYETYLIDLSVQHKLAALEKAMKGSK